MKHLFILNPKAGRKDCTAEYASRIRAYFADNPGDFEIALTQYPGHATELARAAAQSGAPHRIYAFGGDGTLNEVVNGVGENAGCAVGVYPCGSGNDYVRIFDEYQRHGRDIPRLIEGGVRRVDLMRCNGEYGVNEASAGFDADVANNMVYFKRRFGGHTAYMLSLLWCFIRRVSYPLEVVVDGARRFSGDFVFAAGCVGRYYGGGFMPTPKALPDDGLLDFMLIRKVNRLRFLSLVNTFKRGEHLALTDLVTYIQGRRMSIRSRDLIPSTVDGQPGRTSELSLEVVPGALSLIVPAQAKPAAT